MGCLLLRKYEDHPFVFQQLLKIVDLVDLTDEGGRRQLLGICRALLQSPGMTEESVPLLMRQLARVYQKEEDFINLILEIIADVRDPCDVFTGPEAEEAFQKQAERMIELNDSINELTSMKQKAIDEADFGRAGELHKEMIAYQAEFDQLRSLEEDREDVEEYVFTRALIITEHLLRYKLSFLEKILFLSFSFLFFIRIDIFFLIGFLLKSLSGTTKKLTNPGIAALLETLLLPAFLNSSNDKVRCAGLRCLGIYCLLDKFVSSFKSSPQLKNFLTSPPPFFFANIK